MKSELVKGDSLKVLKKYEDNSVDLLCTDPPYGYGFMGRDWDKVLPDIGIFQECFRVLKPGSMAFVMSAPRSDVQYRMAEMLEKVGFRIDYTPIYWAYASGFPKAMNISKMIDKQEGKMSKPLPTEPLKKKGEVGEISKNRRCSVCGKALNSGNPCKCDRSYKANTNKAKELYGSYAGFQPKPAVEVVIVAMKPLDKKGYLEQVLDNGKGVTWFDDCRIPFEEGYVESENQTMPDLRDVGKKSKEAIGIDKLSFGQVQNAKRKPYKSDYQKYVEKQKSFKGAKIIGKTIKGDEHFLSGDIKQLDPSENYQKKTTTRQPRTEGSVFKESGFKSEDNDTAEASPMGRFPANLLVSDNIIDDGKIRKASDTKRNRNTVGMMGMPNDETPEYNDSGGFSRYYSLDAWFSKNMKQLPEPVQKTFPFLIVPKASRGEKDKGLELMEEKKAGAYVGRGGTQEDPNGMFKDRDTKRRNVHPTVKPLMLMNYLVTLGSRKGDMVLDPFMGSGTTPLACISLERKYIGIDNEEEYYEIAKARVNKLEYPLKMWEKFA